MRVLRGTLEKEFQGKLMSAFIEKDVDRIVNIENSKLFDGVLPVVQFSFLSVEFHHWLTAKMVEEIN
ncbi:hypothetical protein T01_9249 [Trichinella spiralis]|uniref:Uncharacterized protein n=1 Tax=Trichinella spiralis TaxID=6334 RepID=A0A0V1AZL2_TRISP|nr:hypothetical protein T01_9249 [Trichinella spiralis]